MTQLTIHHNPLGGADAEQILQENIITIQETTENAKMVKCLL